MKAQHRFIVVDYGQVVHDRKQPCPNWCHLCPHMDGMVFPQCFGTVASAADEYDLLHCTCDPNDPIVAHADLIGRTEHLLTLLRDQRRERRTDVNAAARIIEIVRAMKWSTDQRGIANAFTDIESLATRLLNATRERTGAPPTAKGEVEK